MYINMNIKNECYHWHLSTTYIYKYTYDAYISDINVYTYIYKYTYDAYMSDINVYIYLYIFIYIHTGINIYIIPFINTMTGALLINANILSSRDGTGGGS
jgi:hypothetical protein